MLFFYWLVLEYADLSNSEDENNFYLSSITTKEFNFTPNKNTKEEIWRYLNAANLIKLDDASDKEKLKELEVAANQNQIDKSLVLFFLINSVDKNENDFFDTEPDFHPSELVGFQKNFEYRFLEKIFKKLRNIKEVEQTNIYKKYLKFIGSSNYAMYDINKLK